jgi:hypothetical protein
MDSQQLLAFLRSHLQTERLGCERQGIVGDVFEIRILVRHRPQPCVFELPGSPHPGEFAAAAGKQRLAACRNRPWIEHRKRIECDGTVL